MQVDLGAGILCDPDMTPASRQRYLDRMRLCADSIVYTMAMTDVLCATFSNQIKEPDQFLFIREPRSLVFSAFLLLHVPSDFLHRVCIMVHPKPGYSQIKTCYVHRGGYIFAKQDAVVLKPR